MTKRAIILLVLLTVFSISVFAHAPSEIEARFDNDTKILSVLITHSVKDNSKHYTEEVKVELNGKEIIVQKFWYQDDNSKTDLKYKIQIAKPGDKIVIKAKCNISGVKTLTYTVPEPPKEESIEN
ncbi:MAG: hypothetical protein PHV06_02935 [bacterium]|nr:hypothetical protein [bacterium]